MQNNGAVGSIASPGLPGQGQPNTPDLHLCDQEVDGHQHQTQRGRGVKHREVGVYVSKRNRRSVLPFSPAEMRLP